MRTRLGSMHARVVGDGPPIVLLHGVTENVESFYELQEALCHLATIHAIDLPGHGFTDIPDGVLHLDDMARWVVAYMDAAKLERAVVVGWSMGGGVALSLSLLAPERVAALVLLSSVGASMPLPFTLGLLRFPFVAELMIRVTRSRAWRRALFQGTFHSSFTPHDRVVDRYWDSWRVRGRARYVRALMGAIEVDGLESRLEGIRAPTFIVHGEDDRLVPLDVARRVAAKIPGAQLRVLPRTGHSPHHEEPGAVRAAIRAALESAHPRK